MRLLLKFQNLTREHLYKMYSATMAGLSGSMKTVLFEEVIFFYIINIS